MAARTLISVEEYLATSYRPDCDYVDGEVVERNLGTRDHGWLQAAVTAYFFNRRRQWNITVITELRIRVKPTRFRIPDVCVILGDTDEQILTLPPFICIEILSPKDRMKRVQERIDEYLEMGVPYVWVLNPETEQAYTATAAEGLHELKTGVLKTENPTLEVPLSEIFA
jgi:Uma2 family endonuclease